ncbi:hypothetical protein [Canibacter oris]|uniref:Uncharacterized protein n=1 Tax=Canibacter oris TaxID=1365628 RepID=A0A840DLZ7_9MICO|nr:hypothetical protein [Canibacter oris]MBB4071088.1 hypothetical protein [Canibacter oris]
MEEYLPWIDALSNFLISLLIAFFGWKFEKNQKNLDREQAVRTSFNSWSNELRKKLITENGSYVHAGEVEFLDIPWLFMIRDIRRSPYVKLKSQVELINAASCDLHLVSKNKGKFDKSFSRFYNVNERLSATTSDFLLGAAHYLFKDDSDLYKLVGKDFWSPTSLDLSEIHNSKAFIDSLGMGVFGEQKIKIATLSDYKEILEAKMRWIVKSDSKEGAPKKQIWKLSAEANLYAIYEIHARMSLSLHEMFK